MSKTKWQIILSDLKTKGWSQTAIANEYGVSQSAINYLKTGDTKEPLHGLGDFLIELNTFESKDHYLESKEPAHD